MPLKAHQSWRAHSAAFLAAGIVLVCVLIATDHLDRIERDRQEKVQQLLILQESATMRASIERELNATLFLMSGLAAYVTAHGNQLEESKVKVVLETLYENSEHLRNVGLAPDNVIRYVHPVEGNEAAIGLRYAEVPTQWPAVERAISERKTILDGPLNLAQGGQGLIVRTPVFLGPQRYWGILTLVIDSDSLFQAAGLFEQGDETRHALRWSRPHDPQEPVIYGSASLFNNSPILQTIDVPGGSWNLATVATGATHDAAPRILRWAGFLIALLLSILVFLLVDHRIRSTWHANHDPLTELSNRRDFRRRGNRALRRARATGKHAALAYIDLNGFKAINDLHGHSAGDQVLAEVGKRLAAAVEPGELIARIGGDEFALLIERIESREATEARVAILKERIQKASIRVPGTLLEAASGIAYLPDDGERLDVLLGVADRRMYSNKRAKPTSQST